MTFGIRWKTTHQIILYSTIHLLIDDKWHYTDLELAPITFPTGRIIVEDEFTDACNAGLIPPNEATEARSATAKVVEYLRHHIEPYGQVGWNKLEEAIHLSLPPIRELKHLSIP